MKIQAALKKWKETVSIESLRVEDIVEMLDCMAEHIEKLQAAQQGVHGTGYWLCPKCEIPNVEPRKTCYQCGITRP